MAGAVPVHGIGRVCKAVFADPAVGITDRESRFAHASGQIDLFATKHIPALWRIRGLRRGDCARRAPSVVGCDDPPGPRAFAAAAPEADA